MTKKRVVLIRHGNDPDDDRVVACFRANNIEPEIIRPFRGEQLGDVDHRVVASVVYGGRFDVNDSQTHPFLADEHRWIEQCIANEVPLLGICQGAQSIAHTLGARCGPREGQPHEFGYYTIRPTPAGRECFPDALTVAQAHFHEFELPVGAELLAESDAFPHQAMRYGSHVFAFQFHPEVTLAGFRRWQASDWAPFGQPGAQTRETREALAMAHDGAQHRWFMNFLESFFGKVLGQR